jgi:VCBS repeat-containing protein
MTRFRYLLGLFFLVGPAFAYLLSEWTPQGGAPITWNVSMQQPSAYFNGGSLQYRIITSGPHAITDAARHSNIENAFQSWQDVPDAVIAFTRGPDGTDDTGFSVAYATATGDTQWGGNLAGAAGLASINFVGNEIVDADIAFALLNPGTTSAWGEELEATAVHEGGHAIALEHTPHAQSPMSYIGPIAGTNDQNVGRRLTSDDILALAFAYPNAGYLDSVGSIGGTIEAGPGNPVHKAQIGVFDSSDILVTTTLSRLGQYKVEGLPPGSYTLRAYPSQTVSALIQQDSTLPWTADGLATQFLIGTDQSTTVTAGNTATLNLTVTPGTPTMVSAFGYRDIGGALRAGGFVFTLDRGETGTLGLGGTNFPTQASEFSAFQLSGPPDVLLNNQAFPGWPNNTVNAYDFAVDPAAALGARALMLERDTNEKTVVWGFLEVTDTGAISAASGTNNPASSTINPDTRKVMQQFAMSATATEMVRLRQLTVSNSGSGSTNRVIGVEIFADAAGNGFLDGDDMLIGTANFGGGSTTQIFAHHTIKAGSTENFLVVYQFDGTVVSSETYRSSITAAMTSGVVSGRDIAPTGLPRNGNTHTVEGFNEHTATFGISGNGFLIGPILQLVPNGGSTLGVSPVADTNHYFAGWSGDVQNFDDPLFITNVSSDLVVTANFSYGIANFPYSESFEGAFGVWENIAEDNFDWTRQAGPTPSSPTGPDAASEGNFYVFTDAFGHVPSQTAIIRAPFSFANLGNPKIAFDYHMYGADMGTLFLESSTNGGETWNTVWSKSGDQGNAWHSATVSLAALAGTLNVQLQFRAVMGTGTGYLGDIAIDAITVSDDQALSLVISQAAISENGGVSLATVTRSGDTTNALNVNLSSNNTDAATVPVSINIPAAQTSATFNVTAVDDNLLDGTQTVTIEATATNFAAGQDSIEVTDEEALSLAINLGAIPENGGVSFATVTRHNSDIGAALNVNLASSDTSEATVPVTVTIPAAQGSATFDISAVDDNLLDGTQTVTITATNTSYAIFGQETIDILDHETLTVHVFETAISEADGTSVATVVRTGGTDGPLTVTLSSDDVSEAQVPFDVTIADGDTSASFTVVAQDDLEVDGPQTVTINALHEAYVSVPDTVAVTDHEQLIVNINFLNMPENDGFTRPTITVDRTDLDGNLPITLTSSDISEATVAPTNFTILNGNVSATSTLSAVDDNLLDGPQTVIVTASAPGYIDGQATIDILDHETIDLIAPNPNPISEKGGVSQAQLVRSATNVVSTVSLTSSDTSEATVPATYSFLVGEASTTITITAVDDSILDGFQNVTITPSAAGYFATQNFIGIEDYETLTVNIVFDSISENGGTSQATVTRSTGTAGNLVVDLINVDPSETSTPFQVTIPDGSSSAVFTVTGFDDFDLDGTQTVQIDAGAAGYIGVPDSVDVTDYEELNVYVWMPSVFENDPTQVVFEANRVDNNGDLAVTLSSNDPSEGSVPASFTILDGEYSATSVFTAIDDTILDGPQTVTITLSAVGYADAQGTIEVLDVEDLSVQVTETEMSEFGGSSNAIVKRHNTDIGAALTVMLHSDQAGDEANVPFDITIPAGQSTAAFTVIAVDDALVDGTQIATIGASHESYANSTPDSIAVTDHEELLLTLDFLTLSEDGAPTSRLTVTRTDTTGALLVNLHSDDTSETSVPPSFTIADGMASGTSILTTVDDSLLDGTQTVTLTASAAGYISASKNLAVTDDAVTVTMVADPAAGGNVSGPGAVDPDAGPFAISATPNPGYTFEFWATTDGGTEGNFLDGLTANATVTATFNHCPVANDDSGTVGEDDVRNVPAPGLVGNDVDNNDPLFILSYTQPAKGSVTVATNGAFVYDTLGEFDFLAVGKTATDHFTYTLDDEVCSSVASVVVIVHGVNDCPQALADSASTPEDQQASGNVLFNDSDIDDELLTASNAEGAIGQVTLAADGAFSYNPNGEFDALNFGETATDSFTYTLSDGTCTVVGTVAIVVFGEETLQVSIAASSLREDFQSSIVTVSRAGTVGDLFVSLSSSDISEATVTSFTILDGANSATGVITTVDDSELDGTQTVTIIASAPGYKDGVDSIDVTDHETLALDPALLDPLTENGGATTTMAVFRSASAGTQVINLLSSDISEVTVPATYTFSDGSSTGTIVLTAVDDTLLDGTQTATISISAAGYLGATQPVDIADHETLSVTIAEISMSEAGGSSSAFVSRNNSDIAAPLTVDLFVDDPSEGFVPFQVIIPANSKSETFTVTAQDDFELDGTQTLTVSAAHESYEPPADDSILVTDSEGLTIAPDISGLPENGGANTIVRVFRTDTNGPLAVTLNHNDASEVSLNRTNFTILDGEPAGTAVLTAVDDSILDGTQTVTLTATAPGYGNGEFPYEIFDHETLSLAIADFAISEFGGSTTATVTRNNTDIASAYTITLTSYDTSAATVPPTVEIPAGQASAKFTITAVDDSLLDGTQSVTVEVSAFDYVGDSQSLDVTDYEKVYVSVVPGSISENGGTAVGTVTRTNTDNAAPLLVDLASDDESEATVPAQVTIPPAEGSTTFLVTAQDDNDVDGTKTATITPTAPNYLSLGFGLDVTDDAVTVTMLAVPAGGGSVDGPGTVDPDAGPFAISATPNPGYTFDFWATTNGGIDGNELGGLSDDATVTGHFNPCPTAVDDKANTQEDAPAFVGPAGVLINDIDDDPLRVIAHSQGLKGGMVSVHSNGAFTYNPLGHFQHLDDSETATDTFTYVVSDGECTDVGTVVMIIQGRNDCPLAVADSATTDEATPVSGDVEANDIDIDGDTLTASNPQGMVGLVTLLPNGNFTYDPNGQFDCVRLGQSATDSFTYVISDGDCTDVGTVVITIHGLRDTVLPSITCPDDITVDNDEGICGAVVTYTPPTGSDNCPGAITTQIAGLGSGATFPIGSTTETYQVTDAAGNSSTCSFTITVNDAEAPVITCPDDITVDNDEGICGAVVTYTPPTGTDNCPGAITTQIAGLGSGATFPVGSTTETYQVTDAAGNSSTCSFTVTVNDAEDPVITCPDDITVDNDAGICGAVVTYTPPTGSDNCPGAVTTQIAGLGSGATFPTGRTTEIYEVTDASGNSTTCSFTVTVVGCPSDIAVVITETAISEAGGVATGLVTRSAAGPAVTVTLINSDPTAATWSNQRPLHHQRHK